MIIGTVVGNVWATRKEESLNGLKFLIVETSKKSVSQGYIVAADMVGAGIGENVLMTTGSSARLATGSQAPVDACIVGIIDSVEVDKEFL